jgi:hypothetical protein
MRRNLGAAVTAVINASFPDADWQTARYGDCTAQVAAAQLREWDRVAQRFGFRDASHLRLEVSRRTTPRWAYHHLPFSS